MRIAFFFLLLIFFAGPSFAQVQRCDGIHGPIFQQGPCAGNNASATAMLPPPMVASASPQGAGKQLCKEMAAVAFGDSARIVLVRRWGTETVKFRGVRETAITYEMLIDEKNDRNSYNGARPFYCFVDALESRVFRISAPLRRQPIDPGS